MTGGRAGQRVRRGVKRGAGVMDEGLRLPAGGKASQEAWGWEGPGRLRSGEHPEGQTQ